MKKSIGILYICTGPYVLFWKDFYKSFQEKFLVDFEKRYFVFSDAEEIYGQDDPDVKKIKIEPQPWPLITLLRFSTFLKVEEELKKCDYLMFSNSNMVCDAVITPEEFLPREKLNETLAVTIHPGYAGKKKIDFPYDRNKKSTAYIPWNCGSYYVTYMYSIHSVFIAIDRVKVYSVILFMASLISMSVTLILLKFTELGVYAIAGTSTIVLGFTHGVIVPGCAAKLLKKPIWLFWKSELKSWISLAVTSTLFGAIKFFLVLNNWKHFFISIMIVAALGYFTLFFITFDKNEKREFVKIIKDKLSNE